MLVYQRINGSFSMASQQVSPKSTAELKHSVSRVSQGLTAIQRACFPWTMTGWWLTYTSEKYDSYLGWWHSQYMEKCWKCPNHQPVNLPIQIMKTATPWQINVQNDVNIALCDARLITSLTWHNTKPPIHAHSMMVKSLKPHEHPTNLQQN